MEMVIACEWLVRRGMPCELQPQDGCTRLIQVRALLNSQLASVEAVMPLFADGLQLL